MSFSEDNGYIPATVSELMTLVRVGVNEAFGTDYDEETFLGTNFYKYFYALVQRLQENEVKTSEIVLKLQQYFTQTNEKITRPNTTSPGSLEYLANLGYTASIKKPVDADAGKAYICVDLDDGAADYASKKLKVCTAIKDCLPAGIVSQGTEVETITLSNLQSFDFKFALPDRVPVKLRLTLTLSANNQFTILSNDEVKALLISNIAEKYDLGLDFEPERYFTIMDAPWCSTTLLEYSLDGGSIWSDDVYAANYDEIFTFTATDISIVEA